MSKEMLMEAANKLREIADSLESYAPEEEGEEESGDSGLDKIGAAAAAIRTKMNK